MAWSTIRPATGSDILAVIASWQRFTERHPEIRADATTPINGDIPEYDIYSYDIWTREETAKNLTQLWKRCRNRALKCTSDGIAWGYVGTNERQLATKGQ